MLPRSITHWCERARVMYFMCSITEPSICSLPEPTHPSLWFRFVDRSDGLCFWHSLGTDDRRHHLQKLRRRTLCGSFRRCLPVSGMGCGLRGSPAIARHKPAGPGMARRRWSRLHLRNFSSRWIVSDASTPRGICSCWPEASRITLPSSFTSCRQPENEPACLLYRNK